MVDHALSTGSAPASTKPFIQHSIPVEPHTYEDDEYFCKFTPRIHRNATFADRGSWQCQVDFLEASSWARADAKRNQKHKSYAIGCINPRVGNFTALCACESIPDRLGLITYMIEYAYIHDDVIEYAENKSLSDLRETNHGLMEGLTGDSRTGTKEHVRRRQLQAKMAVELLRIDPEKGGESIRLWKEMSDVFVKIRDLKWALLDDYLSFRIVDAGCPWTMSLLCFATDFALSEEERRQTHAVTIAAYYAWCLVNDYFSFDKEWQNYLVNNREGEIVSAVFLYMKWHSVDAQEAKKMLRAEIIVREQKFVDEKAAFIARGGLTEHIANWFTILDMVTAGNFAWSMTTARYHHGAEDAYPALRAAYQGNQEREPAVSLSELTPPDFPKLKDIEDTISSHNKRYISNSSTDTSNGEVSNANTSPVSPPSKCTEEEMERNDYCTLAVPALELFEAAVLEPVAYLDSLPSKGVRNAAIDGLEVWYQVPEKSLTTIREIIGTLHSCSLMLSDIQDNSELRRGFPSTHTVFGVARTINAANLLIIKALKAAESLSRAAVRIISDRLVEAHVGQGMDLLWTHQTSIPTEAEYFCMIDGKTGSLFILIAELMRSEATSSKELDLTAFMKLVGRFFQVYDDYQSLAGTEHISQKGFTEDISEGKLSIPLIHALQSTLHRGRLLSILQQRKRKDGLSPVLRQLALKEIQAAGGLDHGKEVVMQLQEAVGEMLGGLEKRSGLENWILRLILKRLEI